MCIIAIKPMGKKLMDKEVIQTMCENNPHGNGFCYADNGQVVIKKGYMDFESFYTALNEIPNIKEKNVVLHMRITTHGSTSKGNCHPFPLSNKISHLKATNIKSEVAIIHNGIISSVDTDSKNDLSDTMTYIKNVLYPRYRANNSFIDNEKIRLEIQKEINSKMVIMKSNGDFYTIGDFNTNEDGYIFSNYSYIPYKYEYFDDGFPIDVEDYNNQFLDEDYILLEEDDYIMLDGMRIYGSEEYLYLTDSGVYAESGTYGEFIKISNNAYNYNGEAINFKLRYMEEWGVAY